MNWSNLVFAAFFALLILAAFYCAWPTQIRRHLRYRIEVLEHERDGLLKAKLRAESALSLTMGEMLARNSLHATKNARLRDYIKLLKAELVMAKQDADAHLRQHDFQPHESVVASIDKIVEEATGVTATMREIMQTKLKIVENGAAYYCSPNDRESWPVGYAYCVTERSGVFTTLEPIVDLPGWAGAAKAANAGAVVVILDKPVAPLAPLQFEEAVVIDGGKLFTLTDEVK